MTAVARPLRLRDYLSHVGALFWSHCKPVLRSSADVYALDAREPGVKHLEIKAEFRDGSTLTGFETIGSESGRVLVYAYSYKYERPSGFFFDYELESSEHQSTTQTKQKRSPRVQEVYKPRQHLHVGAVRRKVVDSVEDFPAELLEHVGPHYRSPNDITVETVLALILVNYCEPRADDLEKMLERLAEVPTEVVDP